MAGEIWKYYSVIKVTPIVMDKMPSDIDDQSYVRQNTRIEYLPSTQSSSHTSRTRGRIPLSA